MEKGALNILIFNHSAAAIGGSEYSTLGIAQELKRRGHNVVYASHGGDLVKILERSGIKHYNLPLRRFMPHMMQFSIRSIVRLIKVVSDEEIDCVCCFQYFPLLASCIAQMLTGVPCVYSAIGLFNHYRTPSFEGGIIAYCEEFRDQIVMKNSTIGMDDISIIRNPLDLRRYHRGINSSRLMSQFNLTKDGPKIVMLSRFVECKIKAISDLVDATPYVLERIPQTQVLIVGDGIEFDRVQHRVSKLNQRLGKEAIILTGALHNVPEVLNIADLVIGVGRSVLEGMACQKPAIVLGERGFAGIVQPQTVYELSYFNLAGRNVSSPIQSSELAHAIVRVLADPGYAASLGKFSKRFVEKEFDIRVAAKRLEEICRAVAVNNDNTIRLRLNLLISLAPCLKSIFLVALYKTWSNVRNGQVEYLLSKLYSR